MFSRLGKLYMENISVNKKVKTGKSNFQEKVVQQFVSKNQKDDFFLQKQINFNVIISIFFYS